MTNTSPRIRPIFLLLALVLFQQSCRTDPHNAATATDRAAARTPVLNLIKITGLNNNSIGISYLISKTALGGSYGVHCYRSKNPFGNYTVVWPLLSDGSDDNRVANVYGTSPSNECPRCCDFSLIPDGSCPPAPANGGAINVSTAQAQMAAYAAPGQVPLKSFYIQQSVITALLSKPGCQAIRVYLGLSTPSGGTWAMYIFAADAAGNTMWDAGGFMEDKSNILP